MLLLYILFSFIIVSRVNYYIVLSTSASTSTSTSTSQCVRRLLIVLEYWV